MIPILKTLVNYVIGHKITDDSVDVGETAAETRDSCTNVISNVQFTANTRMSAELENDELAIERLEKEIRIIEGWEDEAKEIDVEFNIGINKEAKVMNDTLRPNVNIKEDEFGTTSENYTNGLPSNLELCQHRIGIVTELSEDYGIIDQKVRFNCQDHQTKYLREGASVNYVVFRRHIEEEWQLHKILGTTDESWEEKKKQTKGEVVKISGAINRKMIGQVEAKSGREILVKPNMKFSLDDIKSDFIPKIGDWLSISALVELDANVQDFVGDVLAIDDIHPLRTKVFNGFITSWDETKQEGVVEGIVWFTQKECEPGYVPALDDAVAVQTIESTNGICTWRAISVALLTPETQDPNTNVNKVKKNESSCCIKNGISIPRNVNVGYVGVGETKEYSMEMCNLGKDHHLLLRGRFHGKRCESQITLLTRIDDETVISPGQTISCRFRVCGKFVGQSSEVFVFTFKGFKMTCYINMDVQDKTVVELIEHRHKGHRNSWDKYGRTRQNTLNARSGILMRGVQPVKPPSFVPVKFGIFSVPEYMWKAVLAEKNSDCTTAKIATRVGEVVPCLNRDLAASNYNSRFHALLYLEEIELNIQMREYDLENVTFSTVGDYLSLEVPGLVERRPSILIGDKVNVESSKNQGPVYEGFVHKVCGTALWLKFHSHFHQTYESEECTVRFLVSRGPIRKCHVAVDLALKNLGEYVLFPNSVNIQQPQVNVVEGDDMGVITQYNFQTQHHPSRKVHSPTIQKPIVKNGVPVYQETGRQYLRTRPPPKISKKPVKLKWFNSHLNYYQKKAVSNILKGEARPLPYVIFGPPGTGKTVTLVETILQIYCLIPDSRILVATPSNSSANLIAERLLISNLLSPGDLIRLVAYHCLEDGLLPEILLPYSTACDINCPKFGESTPVSYKLKKSSNATVLGRHRITVGTCITLGQLYTMGFPGGHFTHVCVDEAGQATEPELLIPLCFLHKEWGQAILAGDPLQLGPVVNSRISANFGFGHSYLARLLDTFPYQRDPCGFSGSGGYNPQLVTRLLMNYRSLPEILSLPSCLFYDSELQPQVQNTGREVSILKVLTKFLPSRDADLPPSMVFHGVRGTNFQDSNCPSWFNPQELVQVLYYLKDFFDAGLTPDDIGVITPYKKQVQKLRSLLNQMEVPIPKIGSVEEFQGQERMVILLSTVRSSSKHLDRDIRLSLGFVASPQRLNVALTRARALLIIIGNPHLLTRDSYWKRTLAYCIDQSAYVGCDVPNDFMDYSCVS